MRYLIIYFLFVFFQCDIVGQSQRRLINYNVLDVFAGSNIQDDVSYFLNQKQNNYLHLSVDEKVGNKKNTFFLFRWDKLISHQDSVIVKLAKKLSSFPIYRAEQFANRENENVKEYWVLHDRLSNYYHEKYGLPNHIVFDSLSRIKDMVLIEDKYINPYTGLDKSILTHKYKYHYTSSNLNPDSLNLKIYNENNDVFYSLVVHSKADEITKSQNLLYKEEFSDINGKLIVKSIWSNLIQYEESTDFSNFDFLYLNFLNSSLKIRSKLIESSSYLVEKKISHKYKKIRTNNLTDTTTIYNLVSEEEYQFKQGLFLEEYINMTDEELEKYNNDVSFLKDKDTVFDFPPMILVYRYYENNVVKYEIRVILDTYQNKNIGYCDSVVIYPAGSELSNADLLDFISNKTIYELKWRNSPLWID